MKDLDVKTIRTEPGEALFPFIYEPQKPFVKEGVPKFGLSVPVRYLFKAFEDFPLIYALAWKEIPGFNQAYCRLTSKLRPAVKTDNLQYLTRCFYESEVLNRSRDMIFSEAALEIEVGVFEYAIPVRYLSETRDGPTTRVAATFNSVRIL
jgi:hypothetical protein